MTTLVEAPHSRENEMMALGCALTSHNGLNCIISLTDNDFYYAEHKAIFFVLKGLQEQGKPADIHLVAEELKRQNKIDSVGGINYLMAIAQYAGTSVYIDEYINLLKDDSKKRKLLEFSQNVQKTALNKSCDTFHQIENLQKELEGIRKNNTRPESLYGHLLLPTSEIEINEETKRTSPGVRVGITLGKIDLKIQGGALTILAGPTGHGKTSVKINMILNYLKLYPDKKAYFFSYEESRAAILALFLNTYIGEDLSENNRESVNTPPAKAGGF
jgi:replicative DNA helicase